MLVAQRRGGKIDEQATPNHRHCRGRGHGRGHRPDRPDRGPNVVLLDLDADALDRAANEIAGRIARLVEKGQADPDLPGKAAAALSLASDLTAFEKVDVMVEAIVEKIEPKQRLFRALEEIVPADAILASNTSSLSIASIASACERPERIFGLHFFNPVPLMKLVEVIHAPATDPAVIDQAMGLAKTLGKTAVKVKDGPAFWSIWAAGPM